MEENGRGKETQLPKTIEKTNRSMDIVVSSTHVQYPAYGKMYRSYGKQTCLRWCAGGTICRKGIVHDIEKETANDNQIDMLNINSISFNGKCLVMVAKLTTSASQNSTTR